ncbi:hypothetical protein [Nocardia anaemiae]|uniref:hypothetical protein n=1 Tax=Nocardia anaemiae TaxID=263910 RepID=UPI0012F482E8|nr:hypothetical protein [Nocardia anaemiae]
MPIWRWLVAGLVNGGLRRSVLLAGLGAVTSVRCFTGGSAIGVSALSESFVRQHLSYPSAGRARDVPEGGCGEVVGCHSTAIKLGVGRYLGGFAIGFPAGNDA